MPDSGLADDHLHRVRRLCAAFPAMSEKLSHGAPTFFAGKRVLVMFVDHHHRDGRVAVWVPAPPGYQAVLIESSPDTYFKPPYVGVKGWIGIDLDRIADDELSSHLHEAWRLVAPEKKSRRVRYDRTP